MINHNTRPTTTYDTRFILKCFTNIVPNRTFRFDLIWIPTIHMNMSDLTLFASHKLPNIPIIIPRAVVSNVTICRPRKPDILNLLDGYFPTNTTLIRTKETIDDV